MTFADFPPPFVTVPPGLSLTYFNRLEPLPRTDALEIALRAETADPLWMLARQRQFGELAGEDAGSPIEVRFRATVGHLNRLRRGGAVVDLDESVPLEALIEAEPRGGAEAGIRVDVQLAAKAGLHWLRLLRATGVGHLEDLYRHHAAFTPASAVDAVYPPTGGTGDTTEPGGATARLIRRIVGRIPDGRQLYLDLVEGRDDTGGVTTLPAEPVVPEADHEAVLAAATRFLAWWEAMVPEDASELGDSWDPTHLEHRFAVQADLGDGPVVLRAEGYRGGHLDWYSFRAFESPDLGQPRTISPPETIVRPVIPTPVSYPGMPADRFWAFEDGEVQFGEVETGRTDVARLLLTEFALTYGNDWFVTPIDLDVGSLCRIESVEVVDTFGETTIVERSTQESWRVFQIDAPEGPGRISELFFLAPTLGTSQESEPVEEVGFVRDEMANVVWAIERSYQDVAGTTVHSREERQREATEDPVPVDHGGAGLLYRLATDVPHHWYPFVPIQAPGAAPSAGAVVLEARPLVRTLPDGSTETPVPRGRILESSPYRLAEEEVPRGGTDVIRAYQLGRWTDGNYHLWTTRTSRPGRGEGSSGLRFDSINPT